MKSLIYVLILALSAKGCEDVQNLYVADHQVDCTGVGPQKCLLIKQKLVDQWSNFYGNIEGFDYEPGYNYLLRVKVSEVKNPPADGSSLKYTLVEIVEKEKTQQDVTLNNAWKVVSMKGVENIQDNPTMVFDPEQKMVYGFAGCNNFRGSYDPTANNLQLGQMAMTRKMCQDMTVETTFTNLLNEVSYYKIEDSKLSFYDSSDAVLMSCVLNDE